MKPVEPLKDVGDLRLRPLSGNDDEVRCAPGADCLSPADKDFLHGVISVMAKPGAAYPWGAYVSYARASPGNIVGACCFKAPPVEQEVEIAYATLPSMEGRGFAKQMVAALLNIASGSEIVARVIAHTLPEQNGSTNVLRAHGFACVGERIDPEDGLVWRWSLAVPQLGS